MDQKKVTELLKKEDFVKKIVSLQTPEEAQSAFKAEGVDVTLDEIKEIGQALAAQMSGKELSDDELEDVAGGYNARDLVRDVAEEGADILSDICEWLAKW